ncbi:MAG: SAM-dependent methyltransferase [Spirochaetales bacterium]|nr:MAG: SAM-dependent methyltransferase [Spirochaetales bacterium]
MKGTLYLVPVPIGDGIPRDELAPRVLETVRRLRDFIVEDKRTARRFLSAVMPQEAVDESNYWILDKRIDPRELAALLEPLRAGRDAAIMSEAGSPCVADPGTALVAVATAEGIRVVPLPGPSAILMALMASGLGGQKFSFAGYLPTEQSGRERALRSLEATSAREGSTQIFIETPYRNEVLARSAIGVLAPDTVFCIAYALSTADESVISMPVAAWKRSFPILGKAPAVFLISAIPPEETKGDQKAACAHRGDDGRGSSRRIRNTGNKAW